jgi:hypothetical protein
MCGKYPQQPPYTHYKSDGATRIDRIYITDTLRKCKQRAETITVPFSEHFAVAVCLTYSHQTCSCKIRLWKMNISLLEENISWYANATLEQMGKTEKYYPNKTSWWDRYVKQRIRQTSQRESASRNHDRRDMEEFYYAAIYPAVRPPPPPAKENVSITVRRLKRKYYDWPVSTWEVW